MQVSIRFRLCLAVVVAIVLAASGQAVAREGAMDTATPQPLVQTYQSLADAILAVKQTEWNLVHGILAATYQHAQGVRAQAEAKLAAGQDARAEIEALAALVSQLGNEGDAAVAAVRKRLVEGGHHHHHASGEDDDDDYDIGFVIVTRDAKKNFLASAGAIGKMAAKPDLKALEAEWAKVEKQFAALHEED